MNKQDKTVSVIMTVKNDAPGCAVTLDSLTRQTRTPDEMIIVDAGSTDGTIPLIESYARNKPWIQLHSAPGVNIARGRNIGIERAQGAVIATIDAGCRAEPHWLKAITAPFSTNETAQFVGGAYKIEPRTLIEQVVGLATMRGQLEPIDAESFNPSARSLAFTKDVWRQAGGFPEWIRFSEDTLFDHKIKRLGVRCLFAPDAVVHWRPRTSLRSIARQFYAYGTGRGHTQIDAASCHYNLRNLLLLLIACIAALIKPILWPLPLAIFAYFYLWAFLPKARAIARHTKKRMAYPLTLVVMWTVQASNLIGYLVGSWQRLRRRDRYAGNMERYLSHRAGTAT